MLNSPWRYLFFSSLLPVAFVNLPPFKMKCILGSALVALAMLPSALAEDNNTWPMQVRLAYAGPTGVTVSWNTFSQLSNPSVKYGRVYTSLDQTASSDVSITYPTSLTWNNHVKLQGLAADTVYWYQPQPSNSSSPIYSFKTSRSPGDSTPHSVAIAVDLGLMGSDGLTTHVGNGAANPLGPNDTNTIHSLAQHIGTYDFLAHGAY
jgi:acid phosphatase type 7